MNNFLNNIKDKIKINNYIILGNLEYLKNVDIIADIIYTIINNYKIISELDTNAFYKSIKRKFICLLKFLIPILTDYIRKKEEKHSIFAFLKKPIFKILRKIIRFQLYCGKYVSLIGVFLAVIFKESQLVRAMRRFLKMILRYHYRI